MSELKANLAWCEAVRTADIELAEECYLIWTSYYRSKRTPDDEKSLHTDMDIAKEKRRKAHIMADTEAKK